LNADDITLDDGATISADITLDLNGHNIATLKAITID
jgi:hypothetical protein